MNPKASDQEHFARLDRVLRSEGFEPRPPSAEIAAQDEGTCRRLACARCGYPGLVYNPYVLRRFERAPISYRAFAVCERCAHAVEF